MKLIFVRSPSLSSYLIRLIEGLRSGHWAMAPWSHVAIVAADGLHIVDSMSNRGGVTRRTLASFIAGFPDHEVVEIKGLPFEDAALAWLETQLGVKYDFSGLFGFIASRSTEDSKKWYCYELATETLIRAGFDLPISEDRVDCLKLLRFIASKIS